MRTFSLETPDFFKINETTELILGGLWEQVYLINKSTGEETLLGDFDGVTDVGIISANNDWAITANDKILIWKNNEVKEINREELKCIESLKLLDKNNIELLVDTSNVNSNKAKWNINMETLEITKIS